MRSALSSLDGVQSVDVDYAAKTARVTVEAGGARPEQMISALENAGYGASVRK